MSRMTVSPLFGGSETPSLLDLLVLPRRVIHNMSFSDMEKVSLYVDTTKDGSVDKNATEMAIKLRDEKLPKVIHKRNCKRFEIDWSGFEGLSLESHSSYFTGSN